MTGDFPPCRACITADSPPSTAGAAPPTPPPAAAAAAAAAVAETVTDGAWKDRPRLPVHPGGPDGEEDPAPAPADVLRGDDDSRAAVRIAVVAPREERRTHGETVVRRSPHDEIGTAVAAAVAVFSLFPPRRGCCCSSAVPDRKQQGE